MKDDFYVSLTQTQKAVAAKCSALEREFVAQWIQRGCDPGLAVEALVSALGGKVDPSLKRSALERRAQRLAAKTCVNEFIDVVRQHSIHHAIMEKEEAKLRLSYKARTSMSDVLEWSEYVAGQDEDGNDVYQTAVRIKNISDLPASVSASIKSVTVDASGKIKVELFDSIAATRLLADMSAWKSPEVHELKSIPPIMGVDLSRIDQDALKALLDVSAEKILSAL